MEIFLHYRWLFVKGNVFTDELEIFGAEAFLCYSEFFIKGDFIIDGVECIDLTLLNIHVPKGKISRVTPHYCQVCATTNMPLKC